MRSMTIVSPLSPGDRVYCIKYAPLSKQCESCGTGEKACCVSCTQCDGRGRIKTSEPKWLCDGVTRTVVRLLVYTKGKIQVDFSGVSFMRDDLFPLEDCFATIAEASDECLRRNTEIAQAKQKLATRGRV